MKIELKSFKLVCENCGMELTYDNIYSEEIGGKVHYFCCKNCAAEFKARLGENK
ncbi:MAG: TRASH domain-containing protein [Sulfolobaceae archaeon]